MNTKIFSVPETADARFYNFMAGATAGLVESPVRFERNKETGALRVYDMPVFRSGTFRDSWGDQTTWEPEHIQAMADNYATLSSRQILESVPVRDGHPAFLSGLAPGAGAVVGWHDELLTKDLKARDGNTYTYLLAHYQITEPDAVGKIERKTWRNRSAEIGTYRANNEAEYWPTYMGVAYVDLPAVEHLNGHSKAFSKDSPNKFFFMSGEGAPVGDEKKTETAVTPETPAAPAAPAPVQQHAAPAPSFKLFGRETTDVAAVQAHIGMLEQFQSDTKKSVRLDFVKGLAAANKILAAAIDSTNEFAQSLTDEQYGKWVETWNNAQAVPSVGAAPQGAQPTTPDAGTVDAKASRIADLEGTLALHRASGKTEAQIKELPSYKELQTLKAS